MTRCCRNRFGRSDFWTSCVQQCAASQDISLGCQVMEPHVKAEITDIAFQGGHKLVFRHRVLPNLPRHDRSFWSDTVVPEADADPGGRLSHNATGSMGWISGQARASKWFEAKPTHRCPMASGRYGSSCSNLMHGILSPQNASDGFESARSIGRRRTSFVRSRHLSLRSITQQRGVPARAADPRT